jgi:hypothetical protein
VKEIKLPASHFMPGVSHMLNNARGRENSPNYNNRAAKTDNERGG